MQKLQRYFQWQQQKIKALKMIINLSKKSKKPIFLIRNLEIIVTSFVNFACADFAQHQQSFSQSSKLIGIVLCCQYLNERFAQYLQCKKIKFIIRSYQCLKLLTVHYASILDAGSICIMQTTSALYSNAVFLIVFAVLTT